MMGDISGARTEKVQGQQAADEFRALAGEASHEGNELWPPLSARTRALEEVTGRWGKTV